MEQSKEIVKVLEECNKVITALAVGGGISYDRLYMIDLSSRVRLAIRVAAQTTADTDTNTPAA